MKISKITQIMISTTKTRVIGAATTMTKKKPWKKKKKKNTTPRK